MRNLLLVIITWLLLSGPTWAQGWTVSIGGDVTLAGSAALFPRGQDNRPSIGNQQDTDTGIRFPAAGQMSFILDGSRAVLFDANGFVVGVNYFNFGTVAGASGYGIRNNSGTVEYKNSGGAWGTVISTGIANTFSAQQTFTLAPIFSSGTANRVMALDSGKALTTSFVSADLLGSLTDETGTGVAVFNTAPALSGTLTGTYTLGGTPTLPLLSSTNYPATTSAQLFGVISDETGGTGVLVGSISPALTTPSLGVATATSINKVALTAPTNAATLTIADNKVFTVNNTLTFTGTDTSSVAFGAGGTTAYKGTSLAQFAATTSAELRSVLSDELGTGAAVFGGADVTLGNLTVSTCTGCGTSAAGSDTQVQFNDGGTAFGGDAGMTYSKSTDTLTVVGDVNVGGGDIIGTADVILRRNTSDASDNGSVGIHGGGAAGNSRGAGVIVYGNESGGTGGITMNVGNVASSTLTINGSSSAALIITGSTNAINIYGAGAGGAGDDYMCLSSGQAVHHGATCVASSAAFKQNVRTLPLNLGRFMSLRPVSYSWKPDYYQGKPDIGFIAEEVAAVDPRLAIYQDGKPYSIGDREILALAVRVIQAQQKQIQALAARLEALESK